jgi:hypothetical protein
MNAYFMGAIFLKWKRFDDVKRCPGVQINFDGFTLNEATGKSARTGSLKALRCESETREK